MLASSIIDLAGGHQPMHNAEGTVSITFNGEIFNYLELRRELEQKGHRFRQTQTPKSFSISMRKTGTTACVDLTVSGRSRSGTSDARSCFSRVTG